MWRQLRQQNIYTRKTSTNYQTFFSPISSNNSAIGLCHKGAANPKKLLVKLVLRASSIAVLLSLCIGYFAENTKFSVIKKCDYRPTINCFICAILILHTILFHYYNSQILFNLKSNINKTVITWHRYVHQIQIIWGATSQMSIFCYNVYITQSL